MARKPTDKAKSDKTDKAKQSDPSGQSASDSAETYKVGPGRPPREYQFKPGQSGNPKGAKRKQIGIAGELKQLFERSLSRTLKLRMGEREQILSKAAVGFDQLANQFAKGDRHARRDVILLADAFGIDLAGSSSKPLEQAVTPNHQAILDAYIARRTNPEGLAAGSPVLAPPDLLDDDSDV